MDLAYICFDESISPLTVVVLIRVFSSKICCFSSQVHYHWLFCVGGGGGLGARWWGNPAAMRRRRLPEMWLVQPRWTKLDVIACAGGGLGPLWSPTATKNISNYYYFHPTLHVFVLCLRWFMDLQEEAIWALKAARNALKSIKITGGRTSGKKVFWIVFGSSQNLSCDKKAAENYFSYIPIPLSLPNHVFVTFRELVILNAAVLIDFLTGMQSIILVF